MEGEDAAFCVICGGTGTPLIEGLCPACYAERTALVRLPPTITVVACPTCGARQVRNHWEPAGSPGLLRREDLDPHLEVLPPAQMERVDWEEGGENPMVRELTGTIRLRVGGLAREVRAVTEVRWVHRSCPTCSRRGGKFYTAHIQLRPEEGRTRRSAAEFKAWSLRLWREYFREAPASLRESLAWEEELKEGWDIYFMDTAAARALARGFQLRLGASHKESASLWGVRDGREVYRATFLVRLPSLVPGDLLAWDERLWEIRAREADGHLVVLDVQSGGTRRLSSREALHARFVGDRERVNMAPMDFPPGAGGPRTRHPESGEWASFRGRLPKPADGPTVRVVWDGGSVWWAPHYEGVGHRRAGTVRADAPGRTGRPRRRHASGP